MKHIFSSLGSNYSWMDALSAATGFFRVRDRRPAVVSILQRWFIGEVVLTYKGRDAIEVALRGLGIGKGDAVLTQALACGAIEEAILRVGAVPVYCDIEFDHLSFSIDTLEEKLTFHKQKATTPVKAVLIQYTLGSSYETEKLAAWCKRKELLLIEDLAQGLGGETSSGKVLGTLGDCTVLSFGRDKVVDSVSGGAVVFRKQVTTPHLENPPVWAVFRDSMYPLLVKIGTTTLFLGFGKIWLWLWRKVGVLTSPTHSPTVQARAFPKALARLAVRQLHCLNSTVSRRREVASWYLRQFEGVSGAQVLLTKDDTVHGSCLRVPMVLSDQVVTAKVVADCREKGVFLSDRWYRSPVDGGTGWNSSIYKHSSCPNAEKVAVTIVNLPTHRYIGRREVKQIVSIIKESVATV